MTICDRDYLSAVNSIREAIARGETYQVNCHGPSAASASAAIPFTLYRRMCRNQQAPSVPGSTSGHTKFSRPHRSLFFALDDGPADDEADETATAPRRPRADDDRRQRDLLAASTKDQAENLMIVDLVAYNDLARIAETGSIAVPALFRGGDLPDRSPDDLHGHRPGQAGRSG